MVARVTAASIVDAVASNLRTRIREGESTSDIARPETEMTGGSALAVVEPDRRFHTGEGDGVGAAELLDEHLGRARERLAAAIGGEAGTEAHLPSSVHPV